MRNVEEGTRQGCGLLVSEPSGTGKAAVKGVRNNTYDFAYPTYPGYKVRRARHASAPRALHSLHLLGDDEPRRSSSAHVSLSILHEWQNSQRVMDRNEGPRAAGASEREKPLVRIQRYQKYGRARSLRLVLCSHPIRSWGVLSDVARLRERIPCRGCAYLSKT